MQQNYSNHKRYVPGFHFVTSGFAGDDEYLGLIDRAINEQMKPDDIKKAIKNWRADNHRC